MTIRQTIDCFYLSAAADIRDFAEIRLAAYEYPREVVFRDALPLTATGKIIPRVLRDEGVE